MRPFLDTRSLARDRKTSLGFKLLFCASLCIANTVSLAQAGVKITYANGPQVAAMFLKFGHIDYPYEARRSRRTGSGIFRVYVHPDGKVKTVGVVRSRFGSCRGCGSLSLPRQARRSPRGRHAGYVYDDQTIAYS